MSDATMSEDIRQQLSALMDGELDRDSARFLMRRIESDAELKAQWTRFHLVRGALRRQTELPVAADFASRVMTQLHDEPAPRAAAPRFRGWLKYTTGGAIAASVAVAALMLGRPVTVPSPTTPVDAPAIAVAAPAPRPPMNDSSLLLPRSPAVSAQAASYGGIEQPIGIDPRLQSYLARHYEAANGAGRGGVAPYVLLLVPVTPEEASRADANAARQQR